jgi:membrane protease YdiL (CAAX protease family)
MRGRSHTETGLTHRGLLTSSGKSTVFPTGTYAEEVQMSSQGTAGVPAKQHQDWLRRFFAREDALYDHYAAVGQAKSARAKAFYLLMHLLPGILGWALINVNSIYQAQLRLTGLPGRALQYTWLIVFAFGWHLVTPVLLLRFKDKLTWKQTLGFLGLNRVDVRGLFVVLPVYCALFALAALPYMQWIWHPLEKWLQSVPAFHMPDYTIFKGGPGGLYTFPPLALLFLFIGNFLGEELYFRGYLMKKIAFLGNAAWIVNSVLFAIYHFWQIPQTWPLVGLVLTIGLLMQLRKDLYVMVAFHFFINMWLTYGEYPFARLMHFAK